MTKTLTLLLAVLTLASINNPTLASTCNGPFSDPVLQRYAAKALADVRLLSPHLSPNGILNSFAQKLGDLVYEGRSRYADPLGPERFREYMRTASFDIWQGCFPELANLIAAAKQRDAVAEKEKADARAQHDAEARKPENRLLTAYKRYAYVKYCNESRQGYAAVYI